MQAGLPAAISQLGALVRIPSVSWDGFDPANVDASAAAVKQLLEDLGVFETVEICACPIAGRADGPARGARNASRAQRQAHDPALRPPRRAAARRRSDWDSQPFEPTVRGDRLYGRGAADDKAGVMAHIAAIRAFVEAVGADFDLGVVAVHRGRGGVRLALVREVPRREREALAADVIVVADSGNWDVETPALTVALRGNVTFTLTISTLDARVALRHVRGSGARRDAGRNPAARDALDARRRRSPSTDS